MFLHRILRTKILLTFGKTVKMTRNTSKLNWLGAFLRCPVNGTQIFPLNENTFQLFQIQTFWLICCPPFTVYIERLSKIMIDLYPQSHFIWIGYWISAWYFWIINCNATYRRLKLKHLLLNFACNEISLLQMAKIQIFNIVSIFLWGWETISQEQTTFYIFFLRF